MPTPYELSISLLQTFISEAGTFREKQKLPNPQKSQTLEINYNPPSPYTAAAQYNESKIIFNSYHLLIDYLRFGKDKGLKLCIDKYLKEGNQEPDMPYQLLVAALESWKADAEDPERYKNCIPLSIAVRELQVAWFIEHFPPPTEADEYFCYIFVDESLASLLRDWYFRNLEPEAMSQAIESHVRIAIDIFNDCVGTTPNPAIYAKTIDLQNSLLSIIEEDHIPEILETIKNAKSYFELLKKLTDLGEGKSYIQ